MEPLSVAWHAVAASPLDMLGAKSTSALVLGGGPIGLAVVQVLLAHGTKKIIMSEVAARRQAFAREFGAHHVLDPRTYDVDAVSRELCNDGDGPDIVFDCAVSETTSVRRYDKRHMLIFNRARAYQRLSRQLATPFGHAEQLLMLPSGRRPSHSTQTCLCPERANIQLYWVTRRRTSKLSSRPSEMAG